MARTTLSGFVASILVSSILSAPALAAGKWTWNADKATGSVEFVAIGKPAALRIHGVGAPPRGTMTVADRTVSGTCTFDLNSIDTGIALRNKHMREKYLETAKFPKAVFTMVKMILPEDLSNPSFSAEKVQYSAKLKLHGVERAFEGTANVSREDNGLKVETEFELKLADFGITTPSFMDITVSETVEVTVQATAPLENK
jgi:polyisoprenoid-binding protein YceI